MTELERITKERDIYHAALNQIIGNAPQYKPEEEDYDDTESAYENGMEVAAWEAADIAIEAIAQVARILESTKSCRRTP